LTLTLFQLIKIHKGVNSVVKRIKNSEIPSIPKLELKFEVLIHNKSFTNWKEPIDLLKKTHNNNDVTKVIHEMFKATDFNIERFDEEIFNKQNVPNNGNISVTINKLLTSNI